MNEEQADILNSLMSICRSLGRSKMNDPTAMNGKEFSKKVMEVTGAIDWLASLFGDKTVSDIASRCETSGEKTL